MKHTKLMIYDPDLPNAPRSKTSNSEPSKQQKIHYDSHIGIYKIECIVNGNVYIGQSKSVPNRLRQHKYALRSQRYLNKTSGLSELQNDYNEYGESNFVFAQIHSCIENNLLSQETITIKEYVSNGHHIYNHFINTEITGLLCPDHFKDVVNRVIKLLDNSTLSIKELDFALDNIENFR